MLTVPSATNRQNLTKNTRFMIFLNLILKGTNKFGTHKCRLLAPFSFSLFFLLSLFEKMCEERVNRAQSPVLTEGRMQGRQNELAPPFLCRSVSGCYILRPLCYKVNNFWQLGYFSPLLSL